MSRWGQLCDPVSCSVANPGQCTGGSGGGGGGSTGGWIGFTDFLNEGTFAWVDESVVSYTNWRSGQPNNGNNNQHCTQIRPDGDWDDVICDKNQQYVCQKNARP